MGSQQRNVLLSTKLPIKSNGGYTIPSRFESENHYTKYSGTKNMRRNRKKGKK